ncbi:hypothetical protein LTR36_001205 [Oleoguttula mirabilis]|uniref:Uncharacterized protein n=1 Tax=Oleoguttula mirabilis TaxID=1507867 RepID=A0AAV9J397_9PEZI|nr:hypothetical protein LTR36_001205 [Oleoguttula mirabilis]
MLMATLACLQTVTFVMRDKASRLDEAVTYDNAQPLDFFTTSLLPDGHLNGDNPDRVRVKRELYVLGSLFSVHRNLVMKVKAGMLEEEENEITYRATPGPNPRHAWLGLDLEVVSAGTFDNVKAALLEQESDREANAG